MGIGLSVQCPTCCAEPGKWCVKLDGSFTRRLHLSRRLTSRSYDKAA